MQRPSIALIAVVAVAALLRFASPELDPSAAFGTDFLTDEGFYAKNARLRVLTGAWLAPGDDHNHLFLAPLHVALNAVAFAIDGPSLVAARRVTACAGLALVLLVAGWLWRVAGPWAAVLGAALVAIDPALVHLSRVALSEGLMALAAFAAFAALAVRPFGARGVSMTIGLWAIALAVKGSAVGLLPGLVLGLVGIGWLEAGTAARSRSLWRALAGLLIGAAVVLALWFALVAAVPAMAFIYRFESGVHLGRPSAGEMWRSLTYAFATKHGLVGLGQSPLLAHIALMSPVLLVVHGRQLPLPTARAAAAATGWLLGQNLFHSLLPYQPYRYFLAASLPAAVLAGIWGASARELLTRRRPRAAGALIGTAWAAAATLAAHQALRQAGWDSRPIAIGVGVVATMALLLAAHDVSRWSRWLVVVAVGAGLAAVPASTAPFRAGRRDDQAARARLQAQISPTDTVLGFFADTVVLDGRAHSVVVHGAWNAGPDPIARLGVTKLLVAPAEAQWLLDRNPTLAARLRVLDRVVTRRAPLTLYAVDRVAATATQAVAAP